jgi:hypothetical protein
MIFFIIAPAFGIIYTLIFLPFPFLKKFRWSIFYIENENRKK